MYYREPEHYGRAARTLADLRAFYREAEGSNEIVLYLMG